MTKDCTTHHHACDCREAKFAAMEQQLADLQTSVHEACEVYAGMEGFIPRNAEAAYTLRVIEQMYKALITEEGK